MIPRLDIDQKIIEQKTDILSRLTKEIKLPITDVKKKSFNRVTRQGQFFITIDQNIEQKLTFSFEKNSFEWDINPIKSELDKIGIKVLKDNIDTIKYRLSSELEIEITNIVEISYGGKDKIYIRIEKNLTQIGVTAQFENNEWTVRRIL